jgi:HK97 family phage major capsid protein
MATVTELRRERKELADKAQGIITKAQGESRKTMNGEENAEFDRIMTEVDALGATIGRMERSETLTAELAETAGRRTNPPEPGAAGTETESRANEENGADAKAVKEHTAAYRNWLRNGYDDLSRDEKKRLYDQRNLAVGTSVKGGYLVPPEKTLSQLIKFVDDAVYIRQIATVQQVTDAESLGAPSLDTDVDDADWTSEIKTGTEDTAMRFGKRELTPHPLAKRIKVSETLLRKAQQVETVVLSRLAYKFGVSQEKGFLTGNGVQKPLGLFVADARGISTGRDTTVTTTAALDADKMIDAFYLLKAQYQRNATGFFSRSLVGKIRKLKDSQGRYLWEPSIQAGQPDRILDRPFYMSEFCPNTFSTGAYVGLWGDMSFYWIADSLNYGIKRLDELYAETNEIGFIGRAEVDGMPVLEEAFSRLVW